MKNLILIGPPGAGKGTQAQRLVDHLQVRQYATGDMLRSAIAEGTQLGKDAKGYMDRGELVPDEVVVGIVGEALEAQGKGKGFILDGFPRTVAQAQALGKMLQESGEKIDRVLFLEVPVEQIVERISGRRSCAACGAVYHLSSAPPKQPGICDRCGGELIQRSDDVEDAVRTRLETYESWTAPVVDFYEAQGLLRRIDGVGSVADVYGRLIDALN